MNKKVHRVMFFANGAVAAFDEAGEQVPEWQPNLLCNHLRAMLQAGVITADTPVTTDISTGLRQTTVGDWVFVSDSKLADDSVVQNRLADGSVE